MLFSVCRKVEGEGKDTGHGEGKGTVASNAVPLRRWEDWERSRLRKIRREERRRRDFERQHGGFTTGEGSSSELLGVSSGSRPFDQRSTFDGSDTVSVASSDDDHWGMQIGEYNENNAKYPPPPVGLHSFPPQSSASQQEKIVDGADLEAMLDQGWEDESQTPRASTDRLAGGGSAGGAGMQNAPRYQLSDRPGLPSHPNGGGYAPVGRGGGGYPVQSPISPVKPTQGVSSAVGGDWKTHVKRRSGGGNGNGSGGSGGSGGGYGPLGPLDPGSKF